MQVPKNTYITIYGGPNGSGKTTLTEIYKDAGHVTDVYINADDIAKELTLNNPDNLPKQELDKKASQEAQARLKYHMNSEEVEVLVFETVMSHISKVEYLQQANELGLDTRLFFISTDDPQINVSRVEARVAKGGHPVPEEKIISRYQRSVCEMMPKAILIAKKSRIYDNSEEFKAPLYIVKIDNNENKVFILNYPPEWVMTNVLDVVVAENKYSFLFDEEITLEEQARILDRLNI